MKAMVEHARGRRGRRGSGGGRRSSSRGAACLGYNSWGGLLTSVLVVSAAASTLSFASACGRRDPGPQQAEVHGLNEALSRPVKDRPRGLRRLVGLCDFDSHHVRIDGVDHCLVLNGGPEGPLATVLIERSDEVFLEGPSVATLRDIARRLEELTSQRSRHLVLSVDRRPIALIPVASLGGADSVHVKAFR